MSTIKILALPATGWNYDNERDDFMGRIRQCNPQGYYVINGFTSAADLKSRIQDTIDNEGDFPALESLEIWAHGHNGKTDGVTFINAAGWGQTLKGITSWADEASIYLSGCNSGLTGRSVAKALATGMQFETGQFEHHIKVYGAAGYLYGSNACRNPRTECVYIRSGERRHKFFAYVWGFITSGGSHFQAVLEAATVDVEFKPYSGCRNATGANAYNEYKNWR